MKIQVEIQSWNFLLKIFKMYLFYVHRCFPLTTHVPGVHRFQKRVSESLGLYYIQIVVTHHVGAGNGTQVFCRRANIINNIVNRTISPGLSYVPIDFPGLRGCASWTYLPHDWGTSQPKPEQQKDLTSKQTRNRVPREDAPNTRCLFLIIHHPGTWLSGGVVVWM